MTERTENRAVPVLAGVVITRHSAPINRRMRKFCDHFGDGKPGAFCSGWSPVWVDPDGNIHTDEDSCRFPICCQRLVDLCLQNAVNPYYDETVDGSKRLYPVVLSALVTESDTVCYKEDAARQLDMYTKEHPDWLLFVINCHRMPSEMDMFDRQVL